MFDAQSQQYLLAPTGKKGESENLKKALNPKLGGGGWDTCQLVSIRLQPYWGSNQPWQID